MLGLFSRCALVVSRLGVGQPGGLEKEQTDFGLENAYYISKASAGILIFLEIRLGELKFLESCVEGF